MSEIDKNALYGRYQQQEDKRNNLALKVAHKALDIPQDDMNINQRTIHNGVSGKALVGAAAIVGLALAAGGAGTLGLTGLLRPAPVVPAPAVTSKVESPATGTPAPATAYDAIYEQQMPDGSWKMIRREHLKP